MLLKGLPLKEEIIVDFSIGNSPDKDQDVVRVRTG